MASAEIERVVEDVRLHACELAAALLRDELDRLAIELIGETVQGYGPPGRQLRIVGSHEFVIFSTKF